LNGPETQNGHRNGVDTDWWGLLTNKSPFIQSHDLSVQGRTESNSYYFSVGTAEQQNVIKNDDYKRYSFRLNLDTHITDWLSVGIQSFLSLGNKSGASPSISTALRLPPQAPAYDQDGNIVLLPYSARSSPSPLLEQFQQDLEKRNNL